MTVKPQQGPGLSEPVKESRMFLANKDNSYSRNEVDVKLADGRIIKVRAATGGWMGATDQRPYPDFEEVPSGRLDRDELYMSIARLFARRSTCNRGNVGCVAVKDNHIIAAGYNGSPPGMPHCIDVGCGGGVKVPLVDSEDPMKPPVGWKEEFPKGCTRTTHDVQNMVAFAARYGVSLDGATVYATSSPCVPCAHSLIGAGVVCLIYEKLYRVVEGLELVDKANIEIIHYGS